MHDTDTELERLRREHDDEIARESGPTGESSPALCLSGGGFRAAIFHLGAMLRLREVGILGRLALISSVSGGSIVSAWLMDRYLATRDDDETFARWCERVDFRAVVVEGFRSVTARDIRTGPWFKTVAYNWLIPSRRVKLLEAAYARFLGDRTLGDLPEIPRVVFCATNLTFGVNWEFSRERTGDYLAGYLTDHHEFPIARAVAASSSFPPVFGPVVLRVEPDDLRSGDYSGEDARQLRARIELSDGGVYDNLATEPALRRYDQVFVSDAGAPFPFHASRLYLRRLLRYTQVIGNQAGALRRRLFFISRHYGAFSGSYWGLSGPIAAGADGYSPSFVENWLATIRTDLDRFTEPEFCALVNHGYFACQNALTGSEPAAAEAKRARWPYRDYASEKELKGALNGSHRRVFHRRWLVRSRRS